MKPRPPPIRVAGAVRPLDIAAVPPAPPKTTEARAAALLALAGVTRPELVVLHHLDGAPAVGERGAIARRIARRDATMAFLVTHEPVGAGEVLMLKSDEGIGLLALVHVPLSEPEA